MTHTDWDYPRLLLVVLVVCVVFVSLFAAMTSASAFGAYNPTWDGISEFRNQADRSGPNEAVLLNTTTYSTLDANFTTVVILTPDRPYNSRDTARIRRFVHSGGTLVVAEDFGPHTNELLASIGAETRVSGQLLRDERYYYRSPNITVTTSIKNRRLTQNVEQLTFNHASPVVVNNSTTTDIIVNSSAFSFVDANRNSQADPDESPGRRPLVVSENVEQGEVIVIGDPSMLTNSMLDQTDNRQFATRLVNYRDRVLIDYSHARQLPLLSRILLRTRSSGGLQILVGTVVVAAVAVFVRQPWKAAYEFMYRSTVAMPSGLDRMSDTVEQLKLQHPEWDEERIERVARSRLRTRDDRDDR